MEILWMEKLWRGNQIKASFCGVSTVTLVLVPINNKEVIIKEIVSVLALACARYNRKLKSASGIVSNTLD
jgi:hypothetical protein